MRTFLALTFLPSAPPVRPRSRRRGRQTRIPFAASMSLWSEGGFRRFALSAGRQRRLVFRPDDEPLTRLLAARGIGFHASAGGQLDRHSAILVQGARCPVASIVRSEGPPKKAS